MIQNEGVGLDVENLSFEAIQVYLGELIPEDGNFSKNTFSHFLRINLNYYRIFF